MTNVLWVTGRLKAVARGLALHDAQKEGVDWLKLHRRDQTKRIRDAEEVITRWVENGVISSFLYPYRD